MTNALWKKHWLLMLVLGIAVSLMVVSCENKSEDEASKSDAPNEEVVMDRDADGVVEMDNDPVYPLMPDDQGPAGEPYQTNSGDIGTMTLLNQPPQWTTIDLQKYQVTFMAPSGTVVNGQVPKGDTVEVMGIQAMGSNPPFGGVLPTQGITDQPVGVHGVRAE